MITGKDLINDLNEDTGENKDALQYAAAMLLTIEYKNDPATFHGRLADLVRGSAFEIAENRGSKSAAVKAL